MARALTIQALELGMDAEIALVAARMHLTLVEVLGQSRAESLFSPEELVARVRWHLDDEPGRHAAVFVAQDGESLIGHTIVRVEAADGEVAEHGLFATTYVAPEWRRDGVASVLLEQGEQWMQDHAIAFAVTYTDADNTKLLRLYEKHGYRTERLDDEWARATKELRDPPV